MDIRNSTDGLKSLLGVPSAATAQTHDARKGTATGASTLTGDTATLSCAGTEVAQAASTLGIRANKVAEIQKALAAGTYNVPTTAVAHRVVDAMLGSNGRVD
jgi:flagellar biosynthesis anti-sigma factor FlgM